jgi:hypothetical protein
LTHLLSLQTVGLINHEAALRDACNMHPFSIKVNTVSHRHALLRAHRITTGIVDIGRKFAIFRATIAPL